MLPRTGACVRIPDGIAGCNLFLLEIELFSEYNNDKLHRNYLALYLIGYPAIAHMLQSGKNPAPY